MARTNKTYSHEDALIAPGVSAQARIFMFGHWLSIGVDHYNRAVSEEDPGRAFSDYLVATVSAAFAIDSFIKDLPHERASRQAKKHCEIGKTGEAHTIFETLRANYPLSDEQADRWHPALHDLFNLRTDAVHYQGEHAPLFKHQNGGHYHGLVGVYTPEVAERYLRLVYEIMDFAVKNAPQENTDLVDVITRNVGKKITGFEGMPEI